MKFVFISDTHGKHSELILPQGDVLIHAGDISMRGEAEEVKDFLRWFEGLNFPHKIFIAGNHDYYLETLSNQGISSIIPEDIIYLNDSGTTIEGINIWGSPITPWYMDMAFNRQSGEEIQNHWDMIPENTDILITHGPIFQTLDKNAEGKYLGCKDLFERVYRVKPKVHIFGHIHESYGTLKKSGILFINASILNEEYQVANGPIVFEL